jgi:serine/threonine protein kinase
MKLSLKNPNLPPPPPHSTQPHSTQPKLSLILPKNTNLPPVPPENTNLPPPAQFSLMPPAPPALLKPLAKKPLLPEILDAYFKSHPDIPRLNELPEITGNLPEGNFGFAYRSNNRVVKYINLIKYEYYTPDKINSNLDSEILNYFEISKLCPEYFCKFIGYYYDGAKLAIIMEYCGIDLFQYIYDLFENNTNSNKYNLSKYCDVFKDIFSKIAKAVKCLHDNGYVHFDLKLENITVNIENDKVNNIKLIDAGSLTKLKESHSYYPYGSEEYMAPEIRDILYEHIYDETVMVTFDPKPSDIYSFGYMLQYLKKMHSIVIVEDDLLNSLININISKRPNANTMFVPIEDCNLFLGGKETEGSRLKKSMRRSRRQKKRQTRR